MKWIFRILIILFIFFIFSFEVFIFILLSKRIFVLLWFIYKFEYVLKRLMVLNRVRCDCLLWINDVILFVNIINFSLFLFMLIFFIWLLFCIEIVSSLSIMIKRDGDSGLFWWIFFLRLKEGVEKLLFVIEFDMLL